MSEHSLLDRCTQAAAGRHPWRCRGRLTRLVGLEVEARGIRGALGDVMWVGRHRVPSEVVAVHHDVVVLMPYGDVSGLAPGDVVEPASAPFRLRVGPDVLGRVLDGLGRPLDDGPPLTGEVVDLDAPAPDPLRRRRIAEPLALGVRAVDAVLTAGRGQRVGVFAGSGVGKSTLLGMLARGTAADVVVVGLVGERGREVREFLEDDLGPGRDRACTIVATSDQPALMRLKAAYTATRVAEWFRDQGADVLLLVDSLTRFAMARREIGLAAGEPPTTKGYPPSVFAELPKLLERAGPSATGTITAMYTVLVEGDDLQDPVADHARAILDGHVVLSRRLADAGHYPTIDVLKSASRLASKVCTTDQLALAAHLRRLLAAHDDARDLVDIGAYAPGSNPDVDEALARRGAIDAFLRQDVRDVSTADSAWAHLAEVLS